jgi:hypothetical protein
MVRYNPTVIRNYANKLYLKAILVIVGYSILGVIVGIGADELLGGDGSYTFLGLVGGLLFGLFKTLEVRAQAQLALCQVEIEGHLSTLLLQSQPAPSLQTTPPPEHQGAVCPRCGGQTQYLDNKQDHYCWACEQFLSNLDQRKE